MIICFEWLDLPRMVPCWSLCYNTNVKQFDFLPDSPTPLQLSHDQSTPLGRLSYAVCHQMGYLTKSRTSSSPCSTDASARLASWCWWCLQWLKQTCQLPGTRFWYAMRWTPVAVAGPWKSMSPWIFCILKPLGKLNKTTDSQPVLPKGCLSPQFIAKCQAYFAKSLSLSSLSSSSHAGSAMLTPRKR